MADFIPFVPRRAGSRTQPGVDDCVDAASSQVRDIVAEHAARLRPVHADVNPVPVQAAADVAQANGDAVHTEVDSSAIGANQQTQQTVCDADESDYPDSSVSETVGCGRCDHSIECSRWDHRIEIRNAAIRLAAIACGRALQHAVMLHPGIIAAFVDDALTASGYPQLARVRVHPDSIEQLAPSQYDCIGDDGLAPGDVVVECGDLSLGASLLERATLLVASVEA